MFVRSLRERLMLTIGAALSPIIVFAGISAFNDAQQSVADRRDELLLIADSAVDSVEQSLATTSTLLDIFADQILLDCAAVKSQIAPFAPYISNISRITEDGIVECDALTPGPRQTVVPELIIELAEGADQARTDAFYGPSTQAWIFAILKRLENEDGEFVGAASASIKVQSLLDETIFAPVSGDVEIALSDVNGTLFGSERFKAMNNQLNLREVDGDALSVMRSPSGERYDVVVTPVGVGGVYAVLSRPSPGMFSRFTLRPLSAVGLPVLILISALIVAWIAVDRLVVRWLRPLRELAMVYGEGQYDYSVDDTFSDAPREIASFARTFDRMAKRIRMRDQELLDAIEAQDAAVKEIHHRVKNNLQVVTSFVGLQARSVTDREAQKVLAAVRHRIDALSIVHQTLYQYESLDTVNMQNFFDALLNHLRDALGMEAEEVSMEWHVDPAEFDTDLAIPMALFVLEAVTNSMKYAFDEEGGEIIVEMRDKGDVTHLTVSDTGRGPDAEEVNEDGTGLGKRLMAAFAKQVRGSIEYDRPEKGGYAVTLVVPKH